MIFPNRIIADRYHPATERLRNQPVGYFFRQVINPVLFIFIPADGNHELFNNHIKKKYTHRQAGAPDQHGQ